MFKFFFIALVIVLAVTTIPAIRNRVMPPVSRALGPTGEKIATPAKRWKAENGAKTLLRELQAEATAGRPMPAPKEFAQWAVRELRDPEAGTDPWGSPYFLKPGKGATVIVGSPGPDRKKGTEDDIELSKTLER
jgi:hypothetical protein